MFEDDNSAESVAKLFLRDVENRIAQNKDPRPKHVGDRVLVWDCSRLTDAKTDELCIDPLEQKLMTQYPSIVIEDNVQFNQPINLGDRQYNCNLDLIVWNKTLNKVFRTSSEFVKLTDKKP